MHHFRAVLSRYSMQDRTSKEDDFKTPWQGKKGTGGGDGKLDATNELDRG
jgi:hypothetical protein